MKHKALPKLQLGVTVKDRITGFMGIVTARVEYLNGCIQYCVKPEISEDGKMPEGEYIDRDQLEVIPRKIIITKTLLEEREDTPIDRGGDQSDCPKK